MKLSDTPPDGFVATHELSWIAGIGEWDDLGKIVDVLCQAWVCGNEKIWIPVPRRYPTVEVESARTRYVVAAPGLPEGEGGFPDIRPTSAMTGGLVKNLALRLRDITGESAQRPLVVPVDDETTSITLGKERVLVRHLNKIDTELRFHT